MKMQKVDSSNVDEVGYDEENFILRVKYHGNRVYDYSGVPKKTFEELIAAPSVGAYMASAVKPQFQFTRIET